jgi:hypothetical protein
MQMYVFFLRMDGSDSPKFMQIIKEPEISSNEMGDDEM